MKIFIYILWFFFFRTCTGWWPQNADCSYCLTAVMPSQLLYDPSFAVHRTLLFFFFFFFLYACTGWWPQNADCSYCLTAVMPSQLLYDPSFAVHRNLRPFTSCNKVIIINKWWEEGDGDVDFQHKPSPQDECPKLPEFPPLPVQLNWHIL
jgi:hypothetical protein